MENYNISDMIKVKNPVETEKYEKTGFLIPVKVIA